MSKIRLTYCKARNIPDAVTLSNGILGTAANTLTLNGTLRYDAGLLSGFTLSNLQIGGSAGTLKLDQSTASNRTLNILPVKGTGSATLGSLLLSVNKAGLNSGAIFTILNGNKLVTK